MRRGRLMFLGHLAGDRDQRGRNPCRGIIGMAGHEVGRAGPWCPCKRRPLPVERQPPPQNCRPARGAGGWCGILDFGERTGNGFPCSPAGISENDFDAFAFEDSTRIIAPNMAGDQFRRACAGALPSRLYFFVISCRLMAFNSWIMVNG